MSNSVDTLGFRPPQFSEDLAWLPSWLQQHQKEQFDECVNELKGSNLELASTDLKFFQGNNGEGTDANTLSREDGRYNRYRLFLSGEDNSSAGYASSSGNVLHFHLHLSSNGSSQCSPSQPLDASHDCLESNIVVSAHLNDISFGSKVKTCSEVGLNVAGINSLTLNSIQKPIQDIVPRRPPKNKISASHIGENLNARYLKAADITDAVELSIGASEALVIHEIVRNGLSSEVLPTGSSEVLPTAVALEAALQLKKARLERLEDALDSPAEETNTSDSLSDLDDFTMADVYEDIGLSESSPSECACDNDVSQVKETPVSENQYEHVNLPNYSELMAQSAKFDDISAQKELRENMVLDIRSSEDLCPDSVNCDREEFYDNPVQGSNICSQDRYDGSALNNSDGLIYKQTVDAVVDITSYQPQNQVKFHPDAWNSGNATVENSVTYLASDRFRSRWLGGWTGQDVSASPELKQNNKSILKCFAGETSFLSEPADNAPDVNSFVQVHETESNRTSQSSVPFAGLHDEANKGIFLSQDVVRSSSLSLVDPLCSIVPCSISSENATCTIAQNLVDKKNDTEEDFRPTPELGVDNSPQSSNLNEEWQAMPIANGQRSPVTVRRRLISLRTYSTLLPNHVSILDGGALYHNQSFELECYKRLIPLNKNVGCIRSSDKISSLTCNPVSLHTAGRENEEKDVATLNGTKKKNVKKSYHETVGYPNEIPVQASKKRRQPLIFNHRSQLHLEASKHVIDNSTWDKHPKQALVPENVVKLQQNKELQTIQSECKIFHDMDVSVKKRVHFAEADIPVQQDKSLPKQEYLTKNCSIARASKKWKCSKFQSHEQSCITSCDLKSGQRLLFQGIQFLLTGFSSQKEKDIERQIWKHGGIVLSDIPSPNSRPTRSLRSNGYQLPIILCLKKLQTTKFLFGCAVNALILKADWLTNSIASDCFVPPEKYMILPNQADADHIIIGKPFHHNRNYVFERVGIMLLGKHSFYGKLAKIIKHGGGRVFKTLQRLVHSLDKEKVAFGAIVTDDESRTSRHLRQCASEQKIPVMPASWIIKSLHLGKLLPFPDKCRSRFPAIKTPEISVSTKVSKVV